MILFVTVLLIREEWLNLFKLLNISLSRQFCFEMLLKIGKIISNIKILLGKVAEKILL